MSSRASGGLHRLMAWDRPILTDSGGYQVFSLGELTKIDDEGVEFASHIDGARVHLNAEIATEIQFRLGSRHHHVLRRVHPLAGGPGQTRDGPWTRTIEWAKRCKAAQSAVAAVPAVRFDQSDQSDNPAIRHQPAFRHRPGRDRPGSSPPLCRADRGHRVRRVRHRRPERRRRPRGDGQDGPIHRPPAAGGPSALPDGRRHAGGHPGRRPGRRGHVRLRPAHAQRPQRLRLHCRHGPLRLRNSTHIDSTEPVEPGCDCYCCRHFTRGAIRHFFNCGEMLGPDPAVASTT